MTDLQRAIAIKRASWFSIVGNFILASSKLIVGILAGSLSVLGDGIDSSGDVLTSFITLYIATLLVKPPSLKFPYGYDKAETNATSALSFIILFAGIQLGISAIKKLSDPQVIELPDKLAILVIVVSIIGKLILAWQQNYVGKKVNSNMLIANSKNMQGDIIISFSVLIGLGLSYLLNLPILDPIAALLVSFWVIWIAVKIFIETNIELMDGNVGKEVYEQVFQIVESVPGVKNPHRMRIRKIGAKKNINIDIELDGSMTLHDAHHVAHFVEDKIKATIPDVFDVAIHLEPFGDHLEEKSIGISRQGLE